MTNSSNLPPADDLDFGSLGAALWRAKGRIILFSLLAGAITFIGLSMMRPLYTSEARILVQNEETAFTRPTSEQGPANYRTALDEQAVQSQVQVLSSRDLILEVVRDLDLTQNADFARDGDSTPIHALLRTIGLGGALQESPEERAANTVAKNLVVYQLTNSSVIAIEYTSGNSELAAQIANKLADVYIDWQRDEIIEQTRDATAWLDAQIKALRTATAEAEAAVETFKASEGLYAGSNNVTLNAQQLSELNSQLILAEAQESEAQARAKLIKDMLATSGDIDATPEVLNSQLVINLIEQRVLVQRQLAELSATLLPSHPRIQQLRSELSDVRAQIRTEAQKVVKSLENQAQIAAAREKSLRASLDAAKNKTAGQSSAEVKLRALEREAKANRDLLESYLARYRDASARHDIGAVPAQAAIVSRAHAAVLPSFPQRGPITLLVVAATFLLSIGTVLAKAIIVSDAPQRSRRPSGYYVPEELVPSEPEYLSQAEMAAIAARSTRAPAPPRPELTGGPAKPVIENRRTSEARTKRTPKPRPTRQKRPPQPDTTAPQTQADAPTRPAAKPRPDVPATKRSAPILPSPAKPQAKSEAQKPQMDEGAPAARTDVTVATEAAAGPAPVQEPKSNEAPKPAPTAPKSPEATKDKKAVWRAAKPAKRPSWLSVSEPRSHTLDEAQAPQEVPVKTETSKGTPKQTAAPVEPTKKPRTQAQSSAAQTLGADTSTEDRDASVKQTGYSADTKTAQPKAKPGILAAMAAPVAALAAKDALTKSRRDSRREQDTSRQDIRGQDTPKQEAQKQDDKNPDTGNSDGTNSVAEQTQAAKKSAEADASIDFIQRIRQDVVKRGEAEQAAQSKRQSGGLLNRLRGKLPRKDADEARDAAPASTPSPQDHEEERAMSALSPNDLRHYLTQRIATSDDPDAKGQPTEQAAEAQDFGPVLGSIDDVVQTIVENSTGGLPRTMLVAGMSSRAQSPEAAIAIARDLASRNEQVALVDLARGAAAVSGRLNMPRVPGFSDLASGAADFADVVRLDEGSALQVIPAGNPTLNDGYDAPDRFMRVFEALTQTYDCVVLHADMAAIESLMPALKFELPVAVAVLPARAVPEDERESLTLVQRLGCPIVVYGTATKQKNRRFSLFGRKVAV